MLDVLWCGVCRDIVPLGKVRNNFNFNLDSKRVLNFENVVTDDDNVKQVGGIGRAWACGFPSSAAVASCISAVLPRTQGVTQRGLLHQANFAGQTAACIPQPRWPGSAAVP
jgi:hypothetical protein